MTRPPLWAALALGLVMVLAGGCAGGAPKPGATEKVAKKPAPAVPLLARWSADASSVVFGLPDEPSTLGVWDRASGRLRRYKGYRLAEVERPAPMAWLVPAAQAVETTGPPKALYRLDLADPVAGPQGRAEGRWRPWPGPGTYAAYPELDWLKGLAPAAIMFAEKPKGSEFGTMGQGSKAVVPEEVATFEPVGWSPSGDHFAAVGTGQDGRYALIFSAAQGSVVASAPIESAAAGQPTSAAWLPREDVLLFAHAGGLSWLGPDDRSGDWLSDKGWASPETWVQPAVLGAGPEGVAVWGNAPMADELWLVTSSGLERQKPPSGLNPDEAVDWHPEAGLLAWKGESRGARLVTVSRDGSETLVYEP